MEYRLGLSKEEYEAHEQECLEINMAEDVKQNMAEESLFERLGEFDRERLATYAWKRFLVFSNQRSGNQ